MTSAARGPGSRLVQAGRSVQAGLARALRQRELVLVLLACIVGVLSGLGATAISRGAHFMHKVLFKAGPEGLLSSINALSDAYMYLIPAGGGLVLGVYAVVVRRLRPKPVVDPIEANALDGGKMSLLDSVLLSLQTMLGNGFGASVGMEAGYTQWGAGVGSYLGQKLHLRRNDLRILVGCGAAGGIAAAFHAPLTGAFYAFELIIGVYAIPTVAQVMAASLLGFLTAHALGAIGTPIIISHVPEVVLLDYVPFILLGVIGAFVAIGIMRMVTMVESGFARSHVPVVLRPMLGGLAVGALAIISPEILASGEAALHIQVGTGVSLMVLVVLVMKICAAAVSLGSGFRGGLFSAALFMGAMMGKLFAGAAAILLPFLQVDPVVASVVGMAALAVGIVGGPFTMTFLTLESTGSLDITGLVLTAAIVCSLTVRNVFGYSFSTWRLHLRGETIRGAHDVGILRALTVGRVMQAAPLAFPADGRVAELRTALLADPLPVAILQDATGRYAGMVSLARLLAPDIDGAQAAATLAEAPDSPLSPEMPVQDALAVFRACRLPALAVVDPADGGIVGLLEEATALRHYSAALERVNQSLSGDEP